MARNYADNNLDLPFPFPPNLSLVLKLPVLYFIPYLIITHIISFTIITFIIVPDKVIRPNLPSLISPNTIIAPDKDSALILIIVLDRATLQPLL